MLPQGTAASTKNKLPSLITSMETVGAKALEDFADNIKVLSLPSLPCRTARGAVGRAAGDLAWKLFLKAGLQEGRACPMGKPAVLLVSCQCPRAPLSSPGAPEAPHPRCQAPAPLFPCSHVRMSVPLTFVPEGHPDTCLPGGGAMSPQTGVWGGRGTPRELLQGVGLFFPQNDPDKEYNMPKDGTVHELTSNVGAARGLLGRGGGTGGRMDCKVLSAPSRQGLSQEAKPTG